MKQKKIKLIIGVSLVFFLGIFIGSIGTKIYLVQQFSPFIGQGGQTGNRSMMVQRIVKRLDLKEGQKSKVEKIMTSAIMKVEEIMKKGRTESRGNITRALLEIEPMLSEKQKKRLNKIRERIEKHRQLRGDP